MPSRKTISWLLIAVFASSITFVLANKSSTGQASLVRQPIRMKVLRPKEHAAVKPSYKEIQDRNPPATERMLEDEIPKHLPIKIKVKKEKEFKDLQNQKWARDFELQVTNTGDKPIYFLSILLKTDVKAKAGYGLVFPLYFGRNELGTISVKALPDDISIKPGETYSLKIHAGQLEAWEMMNRKENRPQPGKITVRFQILSFGDGTGYGPGGVRQPREWKEGDEVGVCSGPPRPGGHFRGESQPWVTHNWPSKYLKSSLPASSLPVNFFADLLILMNPSPQDCCTEQGCTTLIPRTVNSCVNCPPQQRPTITSCSDPDAKCVSADYNNWIECTLGNGNFYQCQVIELVPCATGPAPSPTPTPTPTPTPIPIPTPVPSPEGCDPNTRPNPTNCTCTDLPGVGPTWICFCISGAYADYIAFPQAGGCDPSRSVNNGSDCCVCINPVPCETGFRWNRFNCQCEPDSVPASTPTPQHYQVVCTQYFWVLYECNQLAKVVGIVRRLRGGRLGAGDGGLDVSRKSEKAVHDRWIMDGFGRLLGLA